MTVLDDAFIILNCDMQLECLTQFVQRGTTVWVGETAEEYVYARCRRGLLSVGIGPSQYEAEDNLKLVATTGKLFENFSLKGASKKQNVNMDEFLDIMQWHIDDNKKLIWEEN